MHYSDAGQFYKEPYLAIISLNLTLENSFSVKTRPFQLAPNSHSIHQSTEIKLNLNSNPSMKFKIDKNNNSPLSRSKKQILTYEDVQTKSFFSI